MLELQDAVVEFRIYLLGYCWNELREFKVATFFYGLKLLKRVVEMQICGTIGDVETMILRL
jgi:hypothetical protein